MSAENRVLRAEAEDEEKGGKVLLRTERRKSAARKESEMEGNDTNDDGYGKRAKVVIVPVWHLRKPEQEERGRSRRSARNSFRPFSSSAHFRRLFE